MKCRSCGCDGAKNKARISGVLVHYCNLCAGVTSPYDKLWKDKLRFEERS